MHQAHNLEVLRLCKTGHKERSSLLPLTRRPDLAQEALQRIVGANAPPVLIGKGITGERLLDRRCHELGARVSRWSRSLAITYRAFSRAAATSSAAWIAFSIAATSRIFGRGTCLNTFR